MSFLGSYLGGGSSSSEEEDPDAGPDPIPVTPTIGTVVAPIDMVARALDRFVDFLRA